MEDTPESCGKKHVRAGWRPRICTFKEKTRRRKDITARLNDIADDFIRDSQQFRVAKKCTGNMVARLTNCCR
jgi:hypothetical protein